MEFDFNLIGRRVRDSLIKAEQYAQQQQRTNTTLMIISIVGSAFTTFLTAVTAAQGPIVMSGIWDWQGACALGAAISLVTTICTGLSQQLNISAKMMMGGQCVGRLRALDLVIVTKAREGAEIAKEYAEILAQFPDVTR